MIRDLAYRPAEPADGRGHLLDLYLPEHPRAERPLVIWTGGSAWMADNGKDRAGPVAEVLTARGYAVAGVSIRSSGQAVFPAQLHDIRAAVRWLRGHAEEYRIDPRRFTVMGDSSGGWAALMAALAAQDDATASAGPSSRVQAAVAFCPPTDFLRMDEQMLPGALAEFNRISGLHHGHDDPRSPESRLVGRAIRTCPEVVAEANPIRYADRSAPPVLLLHGQADALVPHGQSVLLYQALRDRAGTVTFFSVPGAGHPWPDVMDPANHGAHRVYQAREGRERVTVGRPAPTWDAIDQFIQTATAIAGPPTR